MRGKDELGGTIFKKYVEHAVLFFGFEAAFFFGVDKGLLERLKGCIRNPAELWLGNHGLSLACESILRGWGEAMLMLGMLWLLTGAPRGVSGDWIGPTQSVVRIEHCGSAVGARMA